MIISKKIAVLTMITRS